MEKYTNEEPNYKANFQIGEIKDNELDVYVVSWGGVGTTEFMKFLESHKLKINKNTDNDIRNDGENYSAGIKHINHPNHRKLQNFKIKKCIFIYDDVINSIVSLFRRNYQANQVKKLTNDRNTLPEEWNLKDYINNDRDLFEFQQFYYNWVMNTKSYPTLFVKGQSIYKHRFHILKFLDLPISTKFFKHHQRNSDWFEDLEEEVKHGLYDMYGGFNDFIRLQSDVQVQEAGSTDLISNISVSQTFTSRVKTPYADE